MSDFAVGALICAGAVLAVVGMGVALWRLTFGPLYDCNCWACGRKRKPR